MQEIFQATDTDGDRIIVYARNPESDSTPPILVHIIPTCPEKQSVVYLTSSEVARLCAALAPYAALSADDQTSGEASVRPSSHRLFVLPTPDEFVDQRRLVALRTARSEVPRASGAEIVELARFLMGEE